MGVRPATVGGSGRDSGGLGAGALPRGGLTRQLADARSVYHHAGDWGKLRSGEVRAGARLERAGPGRRSLGIVPAALTTHGGIAPDRFDHPGCRHGARIAPREPPRAALVLASCRGDRRAGGALIVAGFIPVCPKGDHLPAGHGGLLGEEIGGLERLPERARLWLDAEDLRYHGGVDACTHAGPVWDRPAFPAGR